MARGGKAGAAACAGCAGALLLAARGAAADGHIFQTAAGDYEATSDASNWERYCKLPGGVRKVKSLLVPPSGENYGSGQIDWAKIRAAYEEGVQEFAMEGFEGTPYFETNEEFFGGDSQWLDTFAAANLDGQLEHHHGHDHFGDHDNDDLEARVELFKKTVRDQVSSNLVMGLVQSGDAGAWDAAAAVWTGCGGDSDDTLYGRSNEVGELYGSNDRGTSKTNVEVMAAFTGGPSPENAAVIERAVKRVAWQSLLKYAHLFDGHMKYDSDFLEHQAEGWGHWRILEAAVARDDPERAAGISAVFALQSAAPAQLLPSIYCYVLRVVDEDLDLVSDEAFGVLEDASNVDCTGELGIIEPEAPAFEWGGIFPMDDTMHVWSMQKVGGSYADPTMRIVLIPTDSPTEETMHSLEGGVGDLMNGDNCKIIEDGETMDGFEASGSCFELHTGSGDDSTFMIGDTASKGLAVYAQHFPTEFERDQHYLKDSAGTDIEPVAQEGGGGHDDHGDHEGHGDHDDHDDHEGHDHGNEDEDADQESRQVGGRR